MIEIAACLAIIGIALIGIIAVLPAGMHTQRDNRQETLIAQDANYLMDIVRNGSHGPDDLTNYIYAVTNYWAELNANGGITSQGYNGYDYFSATRSGSPAPVCFNVLAPINSGSNIVSLLSTPEFTDFNGNPITTYAQFGGVSNHVVAYVRSISGLAAEKGPQANAILQADSFSYRLLAVNAPMPMDLPQIWTNLPYAQGATVYYNQKQWVAAVLTSSTDVPGEPGVTNWVRSNPHADQLALNQRELRLRFAWPQLPNGNLAANSRFINFRTTVGGQLTTNMSTNSSPSGLMLYYYQPQVYTQLP